MLPCKLEEKEEERSKPPPTSHFQTFFSSDDVFDNARLLLDIDTDGRLPFLEEIPGYCAAKGKVPLLSVEALHHLHIFIFVQAVTHVALCILTVGFVGLIIRRWERWEDAITNEDNESRARTLANVHHHEFIKDRGKYSSFMGWVKSFFKQFYGSVTKLDYVALRHGFIMTHCRGHPRFNFHKYVNRALEDDFKRIVGINWYLWFFVVLFLLLNITGWHTYFWISFIPFLFTYGPDACIMGQFAYIVLRLIIGAFIQILCSFSILPLYAIVTQMGTHFKNVIFNEQIQEKLIGWAQKAKRRAHENHGQSSVEGSPHHHGASESTGDESPECTNSSSSASVSIELASVSRREPALEEEEEEEEEDEIVPSNEEIYGYSPHMQHPHHNGNNNNGAVNNCITGNGDDDESHTVTCEEENVDSEVGKLLLTSAQQKALLALLQGSQSLPSHSINHVTTNS
ncbi:MLO-like protein 1-like, partial [Trifolium pratense]